MKALTRSMLIFGVVLSLTSVVGCAGQVGTSGSTDVVNTNKSGEAYKGPELPKGMDKISFGWAELTGYSSRNPITGEVEGLYVDVARNIAEDLGVKLVLQEDSWPTIVLGLEAKRYDITFVGKTKKRESQSKFTDQLLEADFTYAVRKGEAGKFPDLKTLDVKGNTIAVTTGSNTDEMLTPVVQNAEILRVKDVGGALLSVKNGQADAMAGVRDYLIASTKGYDMDIVKAGWGKSVQGITVAQGDDQLLKVMEYEAQRLKHEGVLADLIKKYKLVGVEASK